MAKDTLTLALTGDVPFAAFADAITSFNSLVKSLSDELGVADDVEWVVHDLQVGSAIATVRGECDVIEKVERVVRAYGNIGKALERQKRPDYSDRTVAAAHAITRVLSDKITAVRFETPDMDAVISNPPSNVLPFVTTQTSYGAVEGIVETLSKRKGLRFTLYDALRDRAVSCYVQEGKEDLMREIWGKRVSVEGEVSRESTAGRPVAVRQISRIEILPEVEGGSYLKARGIAPRPPGAPRAEEVIRRLRDA
ncbi:MAG: hypothetical protein HYX97_05405 [Chloroflexi bacterium]|nr:hypothetical protein [Chloroflexota bacterium]